MSLTSVLQGVHQLSVPPDDDGSGTMVVVVMRSLFDRQNELSQTGHGVGV